MRRKKAGDASSRQASGSAGDPENRDPFQRLHAHPEQHLQGTRRDATSDTLSSSS